MKKVVGALCNQKFGRNAFATWFAERVHELWHWGEVEEYYQMQYRFHTVFVERGVILSITHRVEKAIGIDADWWQKPLKSWRERNRFRFDTFTWHRFYN